LPITIHRAGESAAEGAFVSSSVPRRNL